VSAPSSVLVVGASAAGLSTAEALRRKGFQGGLTVLGAEPHQPYDRPPLSKQVLSGAWEPDRAFLRRPDQLSSLDAEFILGDAAVSLDPEARTVHTVSGRALRADAIVVATGLRPRTFAGQEDLAGVHVLRTVDDALALRADLPTASRVVVVGDGVLGTEIAATARTMGASVTLAGPQPAPLESQFGPLAARQLAALHTDRGVDLRLGTAVTGLGERHGHITGVHLATGEVLPADLVVVAFGSAPATDWLTGSGLKVDNGVVCDSSCRAADGVYAVGDVARWHHDGLGALLRLENRTNATEQAGHVAAAILGESRPYTPVPYFWTDQFDVRIQVYGVLSADAEVTVVDGDMAENRFVALYRRNGVTTGVLGWRMPKQARLRRQEVVAAFQDSLSGGTS
jgi:NADPH-dependent 2,4-dienoyl-CoA reductase/sulfur reductase-like enzyme